MYKNFVILISSDNEPSDRFLDELMGRIHMQKLGYSVFVISTNSSRYHNSGSMHKIISVASKHELKSVLAKFNPKETMILVSQIYDFYTYWIYKTISVLNFEYCCYLLNGWTTSLENSGFRPLRYKISFENLLNTIMAFNSVRNIARLVFDLFPHVPNSIVGIKPPAYILCAGEHSINYLFWYPISKNTKIIWGHYYDYEKYLTLKNVLPIPSKQQQLIFIDQKIAEDPFVNADKIINKELYYKSLNRFFCSIEAHDSDIEVVVAAHPRASCDYYHDIFNDRKIIFNDTAELIMNSCGVILHASNSRSYAVLFKKPIIFIVCDEVKKHADFYCDIVDSASFFNKKPINIDSNLEVRSFNLSKELAVDYDMYAKYITKFIKNKNSPEKSVWEILHEEINKGDVN